MKNMIYIHPADYWKECACVKSMKLDTISQHIMGIIPVVRLCGPHDTPFLDYGVAHWSTQYEQIPIIFAVGPFFQSIVFRLVYGWIVFHLRGCCHHDSLLISSLDWEVMIISMCLYRYWWMWQWSLSKFGHLHRLGQQLQLLLCRWIWRHRLWDR